jgi:endoglucanase
LLNARKRIFFRRVALQIPLPVQRHGLLNVAGNRIVDQYGLPVVLRGMSLFWSQWQPQFFNVDLVRWLRDDWKIDVIRVPLAVHEGGYLEHPEREVHKITRIVDAAIALGLYVVIDWHAHEPEPEAAKTFFTAMAARYGTLPNIIYELWNEPSGKHDWQTAILPYHAEIIAEIRKTDPRNLIVVGTQNWSRDVDIAVNAPLRFDNIVYALHFYAASHKQPLRDKVERALQCGLAVMVTEWGTGSADGNGEIDVREVKRWWRFMEKHHISYINWSISDRLETSAALKPGASASGSWPIGAISKSGRLIRRHLRKLNSPRTDAQRSST